MEETLGQRLARLRKEHGLNQTQVGEAIGVEKSTISTYESGSRQVSIDILVALAKYYHVTIDYLLGAGSEKIIPANGLTDREFQLITELVQEISKGSNSRI